MSIFNGQINVSRDLRQNKQAVFGKYDLTDIIFFTVGILLAALFVYIFSFLFKVLDLLFAMILSVIPMLLVFALGFRKEAGMRYFDFMLMNFINDRNKSRTNKISINRVINNKKKNEINTTYTKANKIKKGLREELFESIKELKNIKIGKGSNIIQKVTDKMIIVILLKDKSVKEYIKRHIDNPIIEKIKVLVNNKGDTTTCKVVFELNYSYNHFLKSYIKNEMLNIKKRELDSNEKNTLIRGLKSIKYSIILLKERIIYRNIARNKYFNKYKMFVNLLSFDKRFIPKDIIWLYEEFESNNEVELLDVNSDVINKFDVLNKKVYMLHIYDIDIYETLLKELKEFVDIIVYVIKINESIYINTYISFNKSKNEIEKFIKEKEIKYNVSFNKLTKEQGTGKVISTFYMYNPFNAYRKYK